MKVSLDEDILCTVCLSDLTTYCWQEDTKVGACMVPLDGDENSFSYNSHTCEHILAEAAGRDQKKSAR